MDNKVEPKAPVSRVRWIIGLVLLILGLALLARLGWLGTFYWRGFGPDEWIRFFGLHVVGIFLTVVGAWLAYRSRVAVWVLFLMLLTLAVLLAFANA